MERLIDFIRDEEAACGGKVCAAVRDISGAFDLSFKADEVVSSASVIKLAIMVEAMRRIRDGDISPEMEFELYDEQRTPGSGVMRYLHRGVRLTLEDLLYLMIIVSDNTATNILIDLLGTDPVNFTLKSLGFTKSALQRKMYDWEKIECGLDNVCTAGETAEMLARMARGELLGGEWDEKMVTILGHQQDTDRLGLFLPEQVKLANKTGARDGIVHDCGIVTAGDLRYSIAVFTTGVRSRGEAILAIARISRAVFDIASGQGQTNG